MKTLSALILFISLNLNAATLANPATVFCSKTGGKINMVETKEGTVGLCVFGESASISEWTLFNYKSNKSSQAVSAFFAKAHTPAADQAMADPSQANCVKSDGQVVRVKEKDGDEFTICKFSDGSMMESWTLFRGATSKENDQLVKVLKSL